MADFPKLRLLENSALVFDYGEGKSLCKFADAASTTKAMRIAECWNKYGGEFWEKEKMGNG